MIDTDKVFCTYEKIYYDMWETARAVYSELDAVPGDWPRAMTIRMIPMVQIGAGAKTVFSVLPGFTWYGIRLYAGTASGYDLKEYVKSLGMPTGNWKNLYDLRVNCWKTGESALFPY